MWDKSKRLGNNIVIVFRLLLFFFFLIKNFQWHLSSCGEAGNHSHFLHIRCIFSRYQAQHTSAIMLRDALRRCLHFKLIAFQFWSLSGAKENSSNTFFLIYEICLMLLKNRMVFIISEIFKKSFLNQNITCLAEHESSKHGSIKASPSFHSETESPIEDPFFKILVVTLNFPHCFCP